MTTRTSPRTRGRRPSRPAPAPVAVAAETVERALDEDIPDDLIAAELGEIELLEPATEVEAELTAPGDLEIDEVEEADEEAEFEALVEEPEAEEEEAEEHEADLDELLALQFAPDEFAPETELAEPDEEDDVVLRLDAGEMVAPAGAGEFVCRSCFLIRKLTQLGDTEGLLCRDCV